MTFAAITTLPKTTHNISTLNTGGGGGGKTLIAREKLIKVYLVWPIQYRLNKQKVTMKKKRIQKKHALLQDSVIGYVRGISVVMFLQIQTVIYIFLLFIYFFAVLLKTA